jgi:penicillin amidase
MFPAPLADFLNSTASEWDTPIEGETLPPPVAPGSEVFDLRREPWPRAASRAWAGADALRAASTEIDAFEAWLGIRPLPEAVRGSNNWAVAGTVAADGRAILANDMHLGMSVPNIWYRASLVWTTEAGPHRVTGVTLPGVPSVTVGSNGKVAWGFTNTTADWTDRVLIETLPDDRSRYVAPGGPRTFERTRERIAVKGGPDEWLEVQETIWGPVVGPDHHGRLHAIAWVAHHPEGLNLRLAAIEGVQTLTEALDVANRSGIPAQNLLAADSAGNIGWTIAGRIPRRAGFDGRLPTSWADGSRGWDGWYAPDEYPRVVNPPGGRLVTANNRVVGGRWLEMIGDGGYDPGARARQIRDGLLARDRPRVADMIDIHLDDRAVLMSRWRALALGVLSDARVAASEPRREFRRLVRETWTDRASTDSVGYRLVRQFRTAVSELAFAPFVARLRTVDAEYPRVPGRALEGPVWALVSQRPGHLLDPKYAEWDLLLLDGVDRAIASLTENGSPLAGRTWGEANTSVIQHPLSRGVPWLAWWLDMPHHALPGDAHVPRVQGTTFGASERLAVSPGHEADGYFHMPGGQSGHPLSPHYRDGHDAWVRGERRPFLPGAPVSTLTLRP